MSTPKLKRGLLKDSVNLGHISSDSSNLNYLISGKAKMGVSYWIYDFSFPKPSLLEIRSNPMNYKLSYFHSSLKHSPILGNYLASLR